MSRNPHLAEPFRSILNAATAGITPVRRPKADPGECPYCDRLREEGTDFHPAHDASRNCESGKHAHCSCDTCF